MSKFEFLKGKGMNYMDCTIRQKQILDTEKPDMWDFYTWNLKK